MFTNFWKLVSLVFFVFFRLKTDSVIRRNGPDIEFNSDGSVKHVELKVTFYSLSSIQPQLSKTDKM